jgi:hypothetical protein
MKDPSLPTLKTFTDAAGTERVAGPVYVPTYHPDHVPTDVHAIEVSESSEPIVATMPRPAALLDAPNEPVAQVAAPPAAVGTSPIPPAPPLVPTGA